MPTDYWSKEEGAVFDALSYILPMVANGAISEGSAVKMTSTQTDMYFECAPGASPWDSYYVATRAALADGDVIPVLTYGCYKMTACFNAVANICAGSFVFNSVTTLVGEIADFTGFTGRTGAYAMFGGTSYILGQALQTARVTRDEIVILIGKCA